MNIILDILITSIAYLLIPLLVAVSGNPLSLKSIKRLIIINGAFVWTVFSVILLNAGASKGAGASVVTWSFIGYLIVKKRCFRNEPIVKEMTPVTTDHYDKILSSSMEETLVDTDTKQENISPEQLRSFDTNNSNVEFIEVTPTITETIANHPRSVVEQDVPVSLAIECVEKKQPKKHTFLIAFLVVLVLVLSGLNIYQHNKVLLLEKTVSDIRTSNENNKDKILVAEATYTTYKNFYFDNIEKLKDFDRFIVFVLDGYGNYYYTYDQMIEVTQGVDEYEFWAYNKENAISQGYKPWKE